MRWIHDPDEVLAFGRVLVDSDELDSARDVLDYIEKPQKWNNEHELWEHNGSPCDSTERGWDEFLRGLLVLGGEIELRS
jgi:hypothetical protein